MTDIRTQLKSNQIQVWAKMMNIQILYTLIAHPQSNGQVEVTNRIIKEGLKK